MIIGKPIILLLDTNVIVDVMLNRNQFAEAKTIMELSVKDESIDCVTACPENAATGAAFRSALVV